MDRRLYDEDAEAGMRMAQLLGGDRSCDRQGAQGGGRKSPPRRGALLDAVPAAARHDAGYIFSKAQWLRREDKIDRGRASCC